MKLKFKSTLMRKITNIRTKPTINCNSDLLCNCSKLRKNYTKTNAYWFHFLVNLNDKNYLTRTYPNKSELMNILCSKHLTLFLSSIVCLRNCSATCQRIIQTYVCYLNWGIIHHKIPSRNWNKLSVFRYFWVFLLKVLILKTISILKNITLIFFKNFVKLY